MATPCTNAAARPIDQKPRARSIVPTSAIWLPSVARLGGAAFSGTKTKIVVIAAQPDEPLTTFEEVERSYIRRVLEVVRGDKARAAKILGHDVSKLYRRLEELKA